MSDAPTFRFRLTIAACLLAAVFGLAGSVSAQEPGSAGYTGPSLEIPVPGVEFSGVIRDGNITIPWLAQYIGGVYTFLISIAGLLAAAMMIVGGFQYVTSAGDKTKIGAAKKRIVNALTGLLLVFGSYTILYAINPGLVAFDGLKLGSIQTEIQDAKETGVYDTDREDEPVPETYRTGCKSSDFDQMFKAYASCVKYGNKVLDWRMLKAIACAESGLRPTGHSKPGCTDAGGNCFIGMFQLYKPYCDDGYSRVSKLFPTANYSGCNEWSREQPEFNIALYATRNAKNILALLKSCGSGIALKDYLLTMYVGHNNGPGVMNYIIKKPDGCHYTGNANSYESCKAEKSAGGMRAAVRSFYETKGCTNNANGPSGYGRACAAPKRCSGSPRVCVDHGPCSLSRLAKFSPGADGNTKWYGSCITADYGEVKMCFGFNIVNYARGYGAQSVLVDPDPVNPCPVDTGKRLTP